MEGTEEGFYDEHMAEFANDARIEAEREKAIKDEWREKLKGLINVAGLFNALDENDNWMPEEIVEVILTDEQRSGYPKHQCARIKDDKDRLLYMETNYESDETEFNIDKCFVWQRTGMLGDDYSGWLLFPLSDGKYFKVSYSC